MTKDHHQKHTPVLLSEVLQYLDPKKGESLLDVTAGYGGHSRAILERTLTPKGAILVDRDETATSELKKRFAGQGVEIIQDDFLSASFDMLSRGKRFDIILADIGVSSEHLDNNQRGFSIKNDGPLDMRMDRSQDLSAYTLVNRASEKELVRILKDYGEEYRANKIVANIVRSRPIKTTKQLADIVARSAQSKDSKTHPATKTFQALRVAVNDELRQLEKALPIWLELLTDGGRLAVITFHSLEDRIVKQFFADNGGERYDAVVKIVTKKPIGPSVDEIVSNPRSRSAKLRIAEKIKTKKGAAHVNSST